MGVAYSVQSPQFANFLVPAEKVDWEAYVAQPWRSPAVAELDKQGGLKRRPVARGDSISATLEWLQTQIVSQAQEIQDGFSAYGSGTPRPQPEGGMSGAARFLDGYRDSSAGVRNSAYMRAMSLRPSTTFNKARPAYLSNAGQEASRTYKDYQADQGERLGGGVADWRLRTHNARRRAMLTIMVCIRFQACVKNRKRMRRVDSFSYYIQGMLKEDTRRFAATAKEHEACVERELAAAAAAAAAEACGRPGGGRNRATISLDHQNTTNVRSPYKPLMSKKSYKGGPPSPTKSAGWTTYGRTNTINAGTRTQSTPGVASVAGATSQRWPDQRKLAGQPSMLLKTVRGRELTSNASMASPGKGQPFVRPKALSLSEAGHLADDDGDDLLPKFSSPAGAATAVSEPSLVQNSVTNTSDSTLAVDKEAVVPTALSPTTPTVEACLHAAEQPVRKALPSVWGAPSSVSKYGYTAATGRSLMPNRVKKLMADRHKSHHSEPGAAEELMPPHEMTMNITTCYRPASSSGAIGGDTSRPATGVLRPSTGRRNSNTTKLPKLPLSTRPNSSLRGSFSRMGALSPRNSSSPRTSQSGGPRASYSGGALRTETSVSLLRPEPSLTALRTQASMSDSGVLRPRSSLKQPPPLHVDIEDEIDMALPLRSQPSVGEITSPQPRRSLLAGAPTPNISLIGRVTTPTATPEPGFACMSRLGSLDAAAVAGRLEDEQEAERKRFAAELAEAKEQDKAAAADAAQRALEEQWEAELQQASQEPAVATGESTAKLLSMYVNRANSFWASTKEWGPPTLWDTPKQEEWMGLEEWNTWKARMLHMLRDGGYAVQVYCVGHELEVQGQTYNQLWRADPWELMQRFKPSTASMQKITNVPFLVRVLNNMATSLAMVMARDTPPRVPVVLHLQQEHWEEQLKILRLYNFGGLDPQNILVLHQPARQGYIYKEATKDFVQCPKGPRHVIGSGCSLMQLNWVGEGYQLDKEGYPHRVAATVLEELQARGVKWLVSHQLHDLGLLARGSWVDLVLLPFVMALRSTAGVAAATQVVKQEDLGTVLKSDRSIVLGHDPKLDAMVISSTPTSAGLASVRELRVPEVLAGHMKVVVRQGKMSGTHYLMGLERHVVHMSQLAGLLQTPGIVRAKLMMLQGTVNVRLDHSDLLGHDSLRPIAMKARHCPHLLQSQQDLDELLPLLLAQDSNAQFRKLMSHVRQRQLTRNHGETMRLLPPISPTAQEPGSTTTLNSPTSTVPQTIGDSHQLVVFITSNNVSSLAVAAALALAKPGRDVIHLVTVVSGHNFVEAGSALLDAHYTAVARALVEARAEVLVMDKDNPHLLPVMESYVESVNAEMVIMCTKALSTSTTQPAALPGSVTLAALKQLHVPIMVVNASSSQQAHVEGSRHALKALAVVNHTAGSMVHHLCRRLQPTRGDSLLLCMSEDLSPGAVFRMNAAGSLPNAQKVAGLQLNHKEQQMVMAQRILVNMSQEATNAGLPKPQTITLEHSQSQDIIAQLSQLVIKENINILGYMLPANLNRIPDQLIHLLHTAHCAVLICKHRPSQAKNHAGRVSSGGSTSSSSATASVTGQR